MKRATLAAVVGVGLLATFAAPAEAQTKITEQEAHAIGVDAYLYFYSLITMDLTRKQSTNIEPGKEVGKGPMNAFTNVSAYPPADYRTVVRVNFDTLYSIAWLDMTKEPMIISAPNTDARYVDRCVCLTRLAHDRHTGRQLPYYSTRLERDRPSRHVAD